GPEKTELEAEHGAGDGADREEDGGALGPTMRQLKVDPVTAPPPPPLGHHHQEGHADAHHGKDDVETEGHGHLRPRGEKIGHGPSGCATSGTREEGPPRWGVHRGGLQEQDYATAP